MRNHPQVITLGETMARFTPPNFERIGQSRQVEIHVGGSESNTAVGLARLGHRVSWLSRMTDNPLGRWIVREIGSQGVDISHVVWTVEDRVGTYYLERGRAPRSSQVFYDRAGSAMSRMQPAELPVELFNSEARIFHTTGITLGISPAAGQTAARAVELSRAAGMRVSFDLNYRSRLWSTDAAYRACEPLLAAADYLFLPARDANTVVGATATEPQAICRELHRRWPNCTLLLTMGKAGAVAIEPSGEIHQQSAFAAEEVERLGGGDAFSAGFLSATLEGENVGQALRWACAAAAIKYTLPGDLPLLDRPMVTSLVESNSASGEIRR
ncbi:MAG: sugar kinase [Pirellulaceae bacterium]